MSVRAEVRRERRMPVSLDPGKFFKPDWGQLAVRFAFGAGIAVAAGLVGLKWGARPGGVFLAFPAILPAALTLLERSAGTSETETDALGAGAGAVALLFFAVTVALLGPGLGVLSVLVAAGVWTAAALGLYAAGRRILVRATRRS